MLVSVQTSQTLSILDATHSACTPVLLRESLWWATIIPTLL